MRNQTVNKGFGWTLRPGKHMGNKHMKIRETHIKATGRYDYVAIRVSRIRRKKKMTVPNVGEDMGQPEVSYTAGKKA